MTLPSFEDFGKIARFSREIVITEKIDGTNAQIHIIPFEEASSFMDVGYIVGEQDGDVMLAGSRNRYLHIQEDNYGFANWAKANAQELFKLSEGRHYGEWWGSGIQRGYGLPRGEKRFSLFNTHRWGDEAVRPKCCHVVPVLYKGGMSEVATEYRIRDLREFGSVAAPGFMKPEGIIIYHTAANVYFKKTLDKDEEPKGKYFV